MTAMFLLVRAFPPIWPTALVLLYALWCASAAIVALVRKARP